VGGARGRRRGFEVVHGGVSGELGGGRSRLSTPGPGGRALWIWVCARVGKDARVRGVMLGGSGCGWWGGGSGVGRGEREMPVMKVASSRR
jgi:hypothetical protein